MAQFVSREQLMRMNQASAKPMPLSRVNTFNKPAAASPMVTHNPTNQQKPVSAGGFTATIKEGVYMLRSCDLMQAAPSTSTRY